MKKAAAGVLASAMLLIFSAPAFAAELPTDVVIGGGACSEKDVVLIIPNPANDDVIRVCFNYPV